MNSEFNVADHNCLKINLFHTQKKLNEQIKITSWKNYSAKALQRELKKNESNLQEESTNIDEKFNVFTNAMKISLDPLLKELTVKRSNSYKWFNNDLKLLKNKKNDAQKLLSAFDNELNRKNYVFLRNTYKNALRDAENNFLQNEIETNKNDSKNYGKQ